MPFRLNFDDTLKEPDMLPASFPNLLVNGAGGIAVGLATNIPPHNLRESIDAVIAQIDNPDITVDELMQILPAPDFPTGGILLNTPELRAAYETGRGKLLLRARTHVEDGPAGRKLIVITEIPYQVNKSAMLEKILRLSEEKKAALGCIYDIRDESDRTGHAGRDRAAQGRGRGQGAGLSVQIQRYAGHLRREHGGDRRRQAPAI